MQEVSPVQLTCTVELKPGEQLTLPESLVAKVGPGHWIVTMQRFPETSTASPPRRHRAFLNGYAPDDEGLYDDLGR